MTTVPADNSDLLDEDEAFALVYDFRAAPLEKDPHAENDRRLRLIRDLTDVGWLRVTEATKLDHVSWAVFFLQSGLEPGLEPGAAFLFKVWDTMLTSDFRDPLEDSVRLKRGYNRVGYARAAAKIRARQSR